MTRLSSLRREHDVGSAVVEFVVVIPMLMLLVLAVVQVTLALYVRTEIAAAAAEGARVAASSGGSTALGAARTRSVLDSSLASGVVESVTAREVRVSGVSTVEVEVRARLPLLGLLGPTSLVVRGHAIAE
jgi:Flp pilus assembly protein TadG